MIIYIENIFLSEEGEGKVALQRKEEFLKKSGLEKKFLKRKKLGDFFLKK